MFTSVLQCLGTDIEPNGQPPKSEKEILRILIQGVLDATTEENKASEAFNAVMGQFPSGLPHPDGSQCIADYSRRLSSARGKVTVARARLSDFLERGIVPADLTRRRVSGNPFHGRSGMGPEK